MLGIDYSFARPDPAAIKAAGYGFVCRYLASAAGKRITSAEVSGLQANGLAIVLVFEDYANQALNGYNQGVADAQEALAQANGIGFPSSLPIYFAVDFDATPAQQVAIDAYLHGAATVLGVSRVGVYGGFYVVSRCAANGTATWFWQTLGWSGGQIFSGVHIYQNGNSAFAGGADVDESRQTNYGQWPIKGAIAMPSAQDVINQFKGWGWPEGSQPSQQQIDYYTKHDWGALNGDLLAYNHQQLKALAASNADLQAKVTDLTTKVADATSASQAAQSQVADLAKQISDLKAQMAASGSDTVNLNALGQALQWAIKRLGLK